MKECRYYLLLLLLWGCGPVGPELSLTRGLIVRESSSIRQGTYLIPGGQEDRAPVVTIRGREIVLDFQGATVQGSATSAEADTFEGVGICIDQATDVTIRNVTIKGYSVGIQCKSCLDLRLENVDLTGNTIPQENTALP